MDASGIDKAVVLPLESPEAFTIPVPTWEVIHLCQREPERLIPFCVVDPRTLSFSGAKLEAHLLPYLEQGCKGFGEHKVGLAVDDPLSMDIYAICGELGLPVLLHFQRNLNVDEPGLPRFEKVVERFPETVFIGHGPAWWQNISAEVDLAGPSYPTGKVVAGGALPRLLADHENVYADLSANSGYNALARDLDNAREFLQRHSQKILFGTDLLRRNQELPILDFLGEFNLDAETYRLISHANAQRLLGIASQ